MKIYVVTKGYYSDYHIITATTDEELAYRIKEKFNGNGYDETKVEIFEYAGGEKFMIVDDLYENLLKQRINVDEAAKYSNRILFVDTDALTTKFYINFLLDRSNKDSVLCNDLANAIHNINNWDLVLFLEPTVEFVQDGTRSEEIASNRIKYSNQIKELLKNNDVEFICLNGDYLDRFVEAKRIIKEKLNIDTKW